MASTHFVNLPVKDLAALEGASTKLFCCRQTTHSSPDANPPMRINGLRRR